jgi:phosphoribosyl 1,2-cyclic phosphodiesterase
MRRKLLMLAAPVALVLASLSAPAFAIANCSCNYCAHSGPNQICYDASIGTTDFCVSYSTNHGCP